MPDSRSRDLLKDQNVSDTAQRRYYDSYDAAADYNNRDSQRQSDAVEAKEWIPSDYIGSQRRSRSFPKSSDELAAYKRATVHKNDIDPVKHFYEKQ